MRKGGRKDQAGDGGFKHPRFWLMFEKGKGKRKKRGRGEGRRGKKREEEKRKKRPVRPIQSFRGQFRHNSPSIIGGGKKKKRGKKKRRGKRGGRRKREGEKTAQSLSEIRELNPAEIPLPI